jgi:hypothetical protein
MLSVAAAQAAPSVTSTSGAFRQGNSVTIAGSGFGTGDTTPLLWDDFEGGTAGTDLHSSPKVGSWHLNTPRATYSAARAHSGSLSSRGAGADGGGFHSQFGAAFPHVNDKFYASFWFQRVGDQGTGQTKLLQLWGTYVVGDYNPGVFAGGFSGEWFASYIALESGGVSQTNWPVHPSKDTWHLFEIILEQSDANVPNGNVILQLNGLDVYRQENVVTHEHSDEFWDMLYYFYGYTNVPAGSGMENYLDDVYLNNSWSRVMLGNAATWAACTHKELMIPTSWSSGSITITANQGSFANGATAYLYVVDAAGTANSAGYPIVVGDDTTYALTVNSGTGGGDYYSGQAVAVAADAAPSGMVFDEWSGDTAGLADAGAAATTYTMPADDAAITATYRAALSYNLTVNSGSGGGAHLEGSTVAVSADPAPSGYVFAEWSGDVATMDDAAAPSTTLVMPSSDAEVTATYIAPDVGLVSWFPFDADASDVIGDNDGTLVGGSSIVTDAERGQVLSLNGSDGHVVLPTDGDMTAGRSEVTLAMWIKPARWTGSDTIYDEESDNWWQFTVTCGKWYTRDVLTGTMGSRDNDVSLPAVPVGEWHHLAFVYSVSGHLKAVYYDGDPFASTSTSVDALTSPRSNIRVGRPSDGSYYSGKLDDVQLYDRALSPTEIAILATPTYELTVNGGTGSGDYATGTQVAVAADAPASGYEFAEWTGDTSGLADVGASSTTLTMPASDAEITATYAAPPSPAGDLNGDGFVGQADLDIVLGAWGTGGESGQPLSDPRADASGDGFVGQADLDIVLGTWGQGTRP